MNNEKDFFQDLIEDIENEEIEPVVDDKDESKSEDVEEPAKEETPEEEQRRKNKDAEEARKRREAEAKKKAEEEAELAKAREEAKKKTDQTNKLGEELITFKRKYPDVDLQALDDDKNFKRYIDGKLLGKKDFTKLYEEYIEMTSEISGRNIQDNYIKKANASSGTSTPAGSTKQSEVFSEAELEKIAQKLPLMSDKEAKKVMEKFEKSIAFYKNNKK